MRWKAASDQMSLRPVGDDLVPKGIGIGDSVTGRSLG